MKKLRTAVIGAGYLGKYHAEKYALLDTAELIAVCDKDEGVAKSIAKKNRCEAVTNYHDLIGRVDAVSIVTPTCTHYDIGHFFLSNGIHVLMEKPITETVAQANELIALALKKNLTLQVGHLERFNPIIKYVDPLIHTLSFVESIRIAPFNPRGTDVDVVLDLMIHDIDLILSLVKSPITDIRANGAAVISSTLDIANARLEFDNGCVANITASRVSFKTERKMRLFQKECYMSLNLHDAEAHIYQRGEGEFILGIPKVAHEHKKFPKGDAILEEIKDFIHAITTHTKPLVSGEEGRNALQTATQITDALYKSKQWEQTRRDH